MPVSKAQQKAVHKYVKANYDRMELTVPKGRKETIQNAAAAVGQSVNAYINQAIDERMTHESLSNAAVSPSEGADGGGATPIPSEAETPSEGAETPTEGK